MGEQRIFQNALGIETSLWLYLLRKLSAVAIALRSIAVASSSLTYVSLRVTLLLRQLNIVTEWIFLTAKERIERKKQGVKNLCVLSRLIPIFSRRIYSVD